MLLRRVRLRRVRLRRMRLRPAQRITHPPRPSLSFSPVRWSSTPVSYTHLDVYKRQALFDDALTRVVDAGAQVVVSSGNHDSAVRLGFGAGLLSRAGVRMCTTTAGVGKPVLVGDVAVYALPYLEPAVAGDDLGAAERTHAGTLRAAICLLYTSRCV